MAQQPDEKPAVDPRAKGLERLQAAVTGSGVIRPTREHRAARARRVKLCRAIVEGDTYATISAREGLTVEQVQTCIFHIRARLPGVWLKNSTRPPYVIAQAYLDSLPRGYRLPTED